MRRLIARVLAALVALAASMVAKSFTVAGLRNCPLSKSGGDGMCLSDEMHAPTPLTLQVVPLPRARSTVGGRPWRQCVVTRERSSRARRMGSAGCRPPPEGATARCSTTPPRMTRHGRATSPPRETSPTARWTGCRRRCSSCRMRPCRRSWTPLRERARCWPGLRLRSRMCRWHRRTGSTPTSGSRTGLCWRPRCVCAGPGRRRESRGG